MLFRNAREVLAEKVLIRNRIVHCTTVMLVDEGKLELHQQELPSSLPTTLRVTLPSLQDAFTSALLVMTQSEASLPTATAR